MYTVWVLLRLKIKRGWSNFQDYYYDDEGMKNAIKMRSFQIHGWMECIMAWYVPFMNVVFFLVECVVGWGEKKIIEYYRKRLVLTVIENKNELWPI